MGRKHDGRKNLKDLSLDVRVTPYKTDLNYGERVCTGLIGLMVWISGVNLSYVKVAYLLIFMTN